jgi:hypothetical protein
VAKGHPSPLASDNNRDDDDIAVGNEVDSVDADIVSVRVLQGFLHEPTRKRLRFLVTD